MAGNRRGASAWVVGSGTALALALAVTVAGCEEDPTFPELAFDAGSIGFDAGPPSQPPPSVAGPTLDAGPDAPAETGAPPACDDGKIDPGEACDPLTSCPTACPANGCQLRTLESGGTCNAKCVNTTLQTACINGDGCCPGGGACNATNDTDCTAACNNGVLETGETCEPGHATSPCPTACPAIACQLRTLANPGTCTAACVNDAMITACVSGDGCCPAGGACNANNDSDCAQSCGNNVVEAGEKCDPLSSCPTVCPPPAADMCQLRKLVNGGTCQAECVDDRRQTACINNDSCCPAGCNANNDNDCRPACDNGVVETGESCDPLTSCPTACRQVACQKFKVENPGTCQARCVADALQTECVNGDGCCPRGCNANNDNDCAAVCDNGVVEPGETCDPIASCPRGCVAPRYTCYENRGSSKTCDLACSVPVTTCGQDDNCCAYTGGGAGCGLSTDKDCAGDKWQWIEWPVIIDNTKGRCTDVVLRGIVAGGSYDITTCAPPGSRGTGNGDWDIGNVTDNMKNTYDVANALCSDPTALPRLAGSDCRDRDTGAETMACASPSPGGFRALAQVTSMTFQVCHATDVRALRQTPLYIWYNAPSAPSRD